MDFNHHAPKTTHSSAETQAPCKLAGSRRRKLWELGAPCHCPLVGTCWPAHALRRLVIKSMGKSVLTDDYELHCGAVTQCGHRNRLSEWLQRDLDQRFATVVRQFRAAKNTNQLALLWKKTMEQGDTAAALWAALTHPDCDADLQNIICRNLHMFQHHAVSHFQLDQSELNALTITNTSLTQELVRTQERSARFKAEKMAEIDRLNAQLIQIRALLLQKDSCIAFLNDELNTLRAQVPDHKLNLRLKQKLEDMAMRQTELEALVHDLRKKLLIATLPTETPKTPKPSNDQPSAAQHQPAELPLPNPALLQQKTVLCVGGRSSNVAVYRDLIERVGGRFAHHDGGREDNASVLDTSLAAADLVICQTGCISHNAYWKVKDFCKRTGKRCVFVGNPSMTALARSLETIVGPISIPCVEIGQSK